MAGSIGDELLIRIGLKIDDLEKGLEQANKNIQGFKNEAQKISPMLNQMTAGMNRLGLGWRQITRRLVASVVAPLTSFLTLRSAVKSYFGDVAKVAEMTGAYNSKLEEEQKKRALIARITKEDIELYKKHREAMTKFQIAMSDLSTAMGRTASPALKWFTEVLGKLSDWVSAHQGDIVRFLKILAALVTTALIPAFVKFAATLWSNPLTWIIAAVVALTLVIDDFIVWLQGGESALGDFWDLLGDPQDVMAWITGAFETIKKVATALWPVIKQVGTAFLIFSTVYKLLKAAQIGFTLLTAATRAFGLAFASIPVIGWIALLISAIILLWQNWDTVTKAFWDAIEWIEQKFQAFADYLLIKIFDVCDWFREQWESACNFVKGVIDDVKNAFNNFVNSISKWISNIIQWFKDVGKAIADAFSFDGIKAKLKNLLPGWAIRLLGGDDKESSGGGESSSAASGGLAGALVNGAAQAVSNKDSIIDSVKETFSGLTDWIKKVATGGNGAGDYAATAREGNKTVNRSHTTNAQITQNITVNAATPEAADRGVTAAGRELAAMPGQIDAAAEGVH